MIKIAEIRKECGISQKELAKHLNISQGNLCEWEKGRIEPNIEFLNKLADFFNVSIDELVGRNETFTEKTVKKISSEDFTPEEIEMIKGIRELNFTDQNALKVVINSFLSKNSTAKEKIKQ